MLTALISLRAVREGSVPGFSAWLIRWLTFPCVSSHHVPSMCIGLHVQNSCFYKDTSHVGLKVKSLSRVRLFATPWTVAHQASPSIGFSRQEYWSGLPVPSPGDLPDPGIEPRSPALRAEALTSEPAELTLMTSKESACNTGDTRDAGSIPGRKIPWRRAWQPTPVFSPGESQGQRSLAGYSP